MTTKNWYHPKVTCLLCNREITANNLDQHYDGIRCRKRRGIKGQYDDPWADYWIQKKYPRYGGRRDREGTLIEFRLTLDEVKQLAAEAGITRDMIGARRGGYVLARYDDLGHYEIGNCRFILHEDNVREMYEREGGVLNASCKPCIVEGISYKSQAQARKVLGISSQEISRRISNPKYTDYYNI